VTGHKARQSADRALQPHRDACEVEELVGVLGHEPPGLVSRVPDPADGRAKKVVYTAKGLRAFEESRVRVARIEARWRRELGAKRWGELRRALLALTEVRE
jgi:hypothetical protein